MLRTGIVRLGGQDEQGKRTALLLTRAGHLKRVMYVEWQMAKETRWHVRAQGFHGLARAAGPSWREKLAGHQGQI
jgi:hypothetical protein